MERLYRTSHEWVIIENGTAVMGISVHAQKSLGDIVFADLPKVGKKAAAGEEIVIIESMKAASPVHAPLSGVITEVNSALVKKPELLNMSPLENGWICKIALSDPAEADTLLTESAYFESIKNQ